MPPYAGGRVTQPMPDGCSSLLSRNEVARQNAGDGLNILMMRWAEASRLPEEDSTADHKPRGREKKSILLGYLYDHPEELRPYQK